MNSTLEFYYFNHNGKRALRRLDRGQSISIEFHSRPGYGYQPGWFLSGWDRDKEARRSFALNRIELPEGFPLPGNTVFILFTA